MFLVDRGGCILSEGILGFRFPSTAWFIQWLCGLYVVTDLLHNGCKNDCGLTFWLVSHFNWIPSGQRRAGEPLELLSSALIGLFQNKLGNSDTQIIHSTLIKTITGRNSPFEKEHRSPAETSRLPCQALLWWALHGAGAAGGDGGAFPLGWAAACPCTSRHGGSAAPCTICPCCLARGDGRGRIRLQCHGACACTCSRCCMPYLKHSARWRDLRRLPLTTASLP